ncbi:MAG: hypothetical protein AB1757_01960 [Acidobacteriota bacterium]
MSVNGMVRLDIENVKVNQQSKELIKELKIFRDLIVRVGEEKANLIIEHGSQIILEDTNPTTSK